MSLSQSEIALLHDHYKDSFALIRQSEQRRDRLMVWLFALYFLLILQIQFPASARGALGSVTVFGNAIELRPVPLSVLLTTTWVLVAAAALKYCQLTKAVERQYDYLHLLEDRISGLLGDDEIYRREGRAYLREYPALLNWAWFYYTILFPASLIVGTIYLFFVELLLLPYSAIVEVFNGVFVVSVIVTIVLYRLVGGRKESLLESYLDEVGESIRSELPESDRQGTAAGLLRLYAVLLLAKGERVTPADVHNAWSAWTQEHDSAHQELRPFEELDEATRSLDSPFVSAIRRAARKGSLGGR